jgi:hypothetical protein
MYDYNTKFHPNLPVVWVQRMCVKLQARFGFFSKHTYKEQRMQTDINVPGKIRNRDTPNVVVKWLPLLLRIREVPGSSLGLKTGLSWTSSVPPGTRR